MFDPTPVTRLSSERTSHPSAIRRSQRCEPRKPAPPVTTARMHPPEIWQPTILSRWAAIDHTGGPRYHAHAYAQTGTMTPHPLPNAPSAPPFVPPLLLGRPLSPPPF